MKINQLPEDLQAMADNLPKDIKAMYAEFLASCALPDGSDDERLVKAVFIFAAHSVHKYYQEMLR